MLQKSQIFVLVATFLSFLLSVTMWFTGSKEAGQFVSAWVPSILCVGIYVQLAVDRAHRQSQGGRHD